MPYYQFTLLFDTTEAERQALVEKIITIHTLKFQVPRLFVNVSFIDARRIGGYTYHGGFPNMLNTVQCNIRPGNRTQEQFDELVTEVANAYNEVINGGKPLDNGARTLQGVFVSPTIAAAIEWDLVLPPGGGDRAWLLKNRKEFERRADAGSEEFKALLAEMDERQDLKFE